MTVKRIPIVMLLALSACSPLMKEEFKYSKNGGPNRREWVRYGHGWTEASHPHVVQLAKSMPGCETDRICFVRHAIEIVLGKRYVSENDLMPIRGQHRTGRASGVIVTDGKDAYLITAAHVGKPPGQVILEHTIEHAHEWGQDANLKVPHTNVLECDKWVRVGKEDGSECTDGVFMACKIAGSTAGFRLADSVESGQRVRAIMHPLGLPMKSSAWAEVVDCKDACCRARYDNASGGSGGAVVFDDGTLAGMVIGALERGPCDCWVGGRCYDERDIGEWLKCESGQPFLSGEYIQIGLRKEFPDAFIEAVSYE